MAQHEQQLFTWAECPPATTETNAAGVSPRPKTVEPTLPDRNSAQYPDLNTVPVSRPLPEAIESGVFNLLMDPGWELDENQVRELTAEQARELMSILAELQSVEDGLRTAEDPRTGRTPQSPETAARLRAYLEREDSRLKRGYGDILAVYAEGFGEEASGRLDLWVRKTVADCTIAPLHRYDPGHPWHYYHEGDNAPPIPAEDIGPDLDAGRFLERDLPKNRVKRANKIREMLAVERERVEEDQRRYQEIVERGAEALSRYDREIAHSSDAMARATALALKYNHIRYGLGRLTWLQAHAPLGTASDNTLNTDASRDIHSECKE